jgi:hypothetical protein
MSPALRSTPAGQGGFKGYRGRGFDMFAVYRFDASAGEWVREYASPDRTTAYRWAHQFETACKGSRTIVRRERAA